MCKCTPEIRTPWCGKPGCETPQHLTVQPVFERPAQVGRPSIYTQELADEICSQLSTGSSLRSVCAQEKMPSLQTIFNWFRTKAGFVEQYARAKEESADAMAEEILDIADDGSNDYMVITKGNLEYNVEDREVTSRSKLRVDTRKWIMSKMKPKKYGEKIDMTTNGKDLPAPILGGLTVKKPE